MMFEITKSLENAVLDTWNYLAPDAEELCEGDNTVAVEFVIDAGRLSMQRFPEADQAVKELIKQHGFADVRRALSDRIPLL